MNVPYVDLGPVRLCHEYKCPRVLPRFTLAQLNEKTAVKVVIKNSHKFHKLFAICLLVYAALTKAQMTSCQDTNVSGQEPRTQMRSGQDTYDRARDDYVS